MKLSQGFKTALVLGIGVGFGIGYLAFEPAIRAQLNKKYRKGVKLVKRQTNEVKESALELLERGEKMGESLLDRGEKELKHVADKGRRIYREVAG